MPSNIGDVDLAKVSRTQLATIRSKVTRFAQSLTGGYRGSRLQKARYMYENTARANFIELGVEHQLSPDEFFDLLSQVTGVKTVSLSSQSKLEQNNPGAQDPNQRVRRQGHYQAQTFRVFSEVFPDDVRGMEFELTENQHSKDRSLPLTISACYREQASNQRALEAWRILRAAVSGKELDERIVAKLGEELNGLFNASVEGRQIVSDSAQASNSAYVSHYRAESWIQVSQHLKQAPLPPQRWVPVQTAALQAMIDRNAALGSPRKDVEASSLRDQVEPAPHVEVSSLRQNFEPGSASSASSQQPKRLLELTTIHRLLPHQRDMFSPDKICIMEENLVQMMIWAYDIKFSESTRYQDLRSRGMSILPTELIIQTGRLLFRNDRDILKKKVFLADRAKYEPTPGFMYCDAGNGTMAKVYNARHAEVIKLSPWMDYIGEAEKRGDIIEAVLGKYRDDLPKTCQPLLYLEHLIEISLRTEFEFSVEHDPQAALVSGSANARPEEDLCEVMEPRLTWDHEHAEVPAIAGPEETISDLPNAEAAIFEIEELSGKTDLVKQEEAAALKRRMLEFKARFQVAFLFL